MKGQGANLSMTRWTDVPEEQGRLLDLVEGTIEWESTYHARRNGVYAMRDEIASQIRFELKREMNAQEPRHPFDTDTPEETAEILRGRYRIRERARAIARGIANNASRQARLLENVDEPTMPEDKEAELMDIARRIAEIAENTRFTSGEGEIFRLEAGRQVGLDDLPVDRFDAAAQAAGLTPNALRTYIDHHDRSGRLSAKHRQAWSRAKRKVAAAFTRVSLLMLLVVLMGVTSALAHQLTHQ